MDIPNPQTRTRTGRLLGWASYLAIESYGSLTVAMFWAFTNSSVHLEGAKSVYGLILAGAQVRRKTTPHIKALSTPLPRSRPARSPQHPHAPLRLKK